MACRFAYFLQAPLLFYACNFKNLAFSASPASVEKSLDDIQQLLHHHLAKAALLHCLSDLLLSKVEQCKSMCSANQKTFHPKHILLRNRGREPSLEYKFAKFGRTIDPTAASRRLVLLE